jgi:hypothetical protein
MARGVLEYVWAGMTRLFLSTAVLVVACSAGAAFVPRGTATRLASVGRASATAGLLRSESSVSASQRAENSVASFGSPVPHTPQPTEPAMDAARAKFLADLADAVCTTFAPCCTSAGAVADLDHCRRQFDTTSAPMVGLVARWRDIVRDARHFDETKATRCVSDVKSRVAACVGTATLDSWNPERVFAPTVGWVLLNEIDSCRHAVSGGAKPGEACRQESDCAASTSGRSTCRKSLTFGFDAGRCIVVQPGRVGAPCMPFPSESRMMQCNARVVGASPPNCAVPPGCNDPSCLTCAAHIV